MWFLVAYQRWSVTEIKISWNCAIANSVCACRHRLSLTSFLLFVVVFFLCPFRLSHRIYLIISQRSEWKKNYKNQVEGAAQNILLIFFFVYAVSFWIRGVARLFLVMNSRATFSFSLVNFLYVFHVLIRLKSNAFTRNLFRFVCELLVCMQTAVRSSKVENCWRQFSIFQIPSQAFNSFLDTFCSNAA